ncbi:hypothetical protein BQ8420_10200 [Nocardiopsis sp. JB363]|nr:hypothetical protein BQ8420_10200 [Nocardiopsis sp. JB363]
MTCTHGGSSWRSGGSDGPMMLRPTTVRGSLGRLWTVRIVRGSDASPGCDGEGRAGGAAEFGGKSRSESLYETVPHEVVGWAPEAGGAVSEKGRRSSGRRETWWPGRGRWAEREPEGGVRWWCVR